MGPIQMLMAQAMRDPELRMMLEQQAPRPHGGLLEQESVWNPRRGQSPMPYRDPGQAGPSPPPPDGPIVSMFRGSR